MPSPQAVKYPATSAITFVAPGLTLRIATEPAALVFTDARFGTT
jgi:hypothetical protein